MNGSIEQLARKIEQYYCEWKRLVWRRYSPDIGDQASFLKTAELCVEHGFNPRAFVKAQTEYGQQERYKGCFLHSRDALQNYRNYVEKVGETEIGSLYSHYNKRLMGAGSTVNEHVRVLGSTFHDYPAWYRIVVTVQPEQQIIDRFQARAREELDLNPNIRRFILSEITLRDALSRIEGVDRANDSPQAEKAMNGTLRSA